MLFEPGNSQHLKPWLVKTLEPICDAEPGALAEYILALLKHNVSENDMRKELNSQLDEFLEKECAPFIDTLFKVLRTKSYLPYTSDSTAEKPQDGGIPIPLDGLLSPTIPTSPRSRKRSLEDDSGGRPPSKGPRLSEEANFARFDPTRNMQDPRAWTNGHDYGMNGVARGNGMPYMTNGRRPQAYQPPEMKRGICRDYHNHGYCSRGALCKFSHGDDAVIPGHMLPMGGGPMSSFMPMFNQGFGMPGGPPTAYDPHEARMDMRAMNGRTQGRPPLLSRGEDRSQARHASGELPVIQDLTPTVPHNEVQPHPPSRTQPASPSSAPMPQLGDNMMVSPYPQAGFQGDIEMSAPETRPSYHTAPHHRGGRPAAGRGRGTFGDIPGIRPERRRDKTLVVEKIPSDKLSLEHVNNWFKRFGSVTNVAIDKVQAKALISFSEHEEAHAAWKSEDAVFGNRFVKVFWHRPMEGHGQKGAKMLASSAPVVAGIAAKEITSVAAPRPTPPPTTPRKAAAVDLAAKQKQLEERIAEQKTLMTSLSSATGDEKRQIMAKLKELTSQPSAPEGPVERPIDQDKKQKDLLDKELEVHASTSGEGEGESADDLKAKLERLKAEAASLGIADGEPIYSSGRGGYRARGRGGRGYFRGAVRGGPPRGSMKLDNRPKQLIIKGLSGDHIESLREWYEPGGQVDSVIQTSGGEAVVAFKSRAAAELGLSKGNTIPKVGAVQISWHTGTTQQAKPIETPSHTPPSATEPEVLAHVPVDDEDDHPRPTEEEVVASGWGGGDEDGMGMF